ncbi:MAG TPA: hypothetical protein V6D47_16580 [Oscillatoriaceae cyanobacterium]
MSILLNRRDFVVFPDGLVQDMEGGVEAQPGDLLSSEHTGITSEPTTKWRITRIEDKGESYPRNRFYHVEAFDREG